MLKGYLGVLIGCFLAINGFSQEKHTISGVLKDAADGEALIGATIYVDEIKSGTVSNIYGFYSLTLPEGKYTFTISYIGYTSVIKTIDVTEDMKLNLELENSSVAIETFEVTAEKEQKNVEETEMSTVTLKMEKVKKIPALFGEVDVLKTIQLLPGVQSGGEGTTGFFVRGGSSDQNLILLDEAPVYNPSHFLGFFSVFNQDAIKDLQIYKGGIPARYGGRLSSLLDIHMKEGNSKQMSVSGGLGLIASRLTLEGPIQKDKSSFIISARRTYADLFLKLSSDTALRENQLYFYDLNAKVNYQINENNKLYLSGYFGRDVFRFGDEFGMHWGNATGTLRWNHLFTNKLFSNFTLIYSNFDYNLGVPEGTEAFEWTSRIIDKSVKADFTYYANPKNTLRFGVNSIHHTFKPGKVKSLDQSIFNDFILPDKYALEHAAYISNEQDLSKRLRVHYGLRASLFQNVGVDTSYVFDTSNPDVYQVQDTVTNSGGIFNSYFNLEPRLSIRYMLNENASLKATYNRMTQYLHQANNSTSSSPLSVWFSSSLLVEPQLADQVALGYFRNFKENTFETSLEVYYKKMYNTIDFRDHAELLLNKYLEGELRFGDSYSYGAEVLLKKQKGQFTGWVGYTYSQTKREIPEINNGKAYFAPYDRTHDISVVASYDLNERVNISSNWVFATGQAITVPTGRFEYKGNVVPVFSDRNAERMPAFHRFDLSLTLYGKKWDQKPPKKNGKPRWKYESNWNFSVYNVYRRQNAFSIVFRQNEDNPTVTEAHMIYFFEIIPSISYNFKF
ncbi:MAG: carboxypeptidase-like regulatory domain-containing protein [Flavobacteriales bacterium]|nr:carboxypeptidase-like regulatory domain-containing protein [Flavobacteriales bacterium]